MLKIVQAPNTVLSQKAKPITKIDTDIKQLIQEMGDTLVNAKDPEGVGLAAPQVGKSLQLFIIKEDTQSPISVYINPTVELLSSALLDKPTKKNKKDKDVKLEGCLSLQDIWGVVQRAESVRISYLDENGKKKQEEYSGFMATIIQHEFDHINGILFPRRVLEQNEKLYKATKDAKGETEFEEIEI